MSEPSGASFAVSINQKSSGHSFISSTESSSSVRDLTASNELSHLKQKVNIYDKPHDDSIIFVYHGY